MGQGLYLLLLFSLFGLMQKYIKNKISKLCIVMQTTSHFN